MRILELKYIDYDFSTNSLSIKNDYVSRFIDESDLFKLYNELVVNAGQGEGFESKFTYDNIETYEDLVENLTKDGHNWLMKCPSLYNDGSILSPNICYIFIDVESNPSSYYTLMDTIKRDIYTELKILKRDEYLNDIIKF